MKRIKKALGAIMLTLSMLGLSAFIPASSVFADGVPDCTGLGCAQHGVNNSGGEGQDNLMGTVKTIINVIIYIVGLIAVVMIIMGGIQYTTSQGDAGKVKKAKDTILYGIIGLVVAILAFAVVNFVLTSVFK